MNIRLESSYVESNLSVSFQLLLFFPFFINMHLLNFVINLFNGSRSLTFKNVEDNAFSNNNYSVKMLFFFVEKSYLPGVQILLYILSYRCDFFKFCWIYLNPSSNFNSYYFLSSTILAIFKSDYFLSSIILSIFKSDYFLSSFKIKYSFIHSAILLFYLSHFDYTSS